MKKSPYVQMPLRVSKDIQMRGEEFLKLVGSLKRSEMQVGSSIPKTVVKSEKPENSNKVCQACEMCGA